MAEEITSRFLNVISLFNGHIPLVAIQMNAVRVGDAVSLIFATVLDQVRLGLVDEDEEVSEVTDRHYWTTRASDQTVSLVDRLLEMIHELDEGFVLNYNKFYIGLAKDGQTDNFTIFRPKKGWTWLEPRLDRSENLELEEAGLDVMGYQTKGGRYRIRLTPQDVEKQTERLQALLKMAYDGAKR